VDDDKSFITKFENKQLNSWNHVIFLHVIWCYIEFYGRKDALTKVMTQMKSLKGKGYHETETYFWVHMVDYYRALYQYDKEKEMPKEKQGNLANNKDEKESNEKIIENQETFEKFLSYCRNKNWKLADVKQKFDLEDIEIWKNFYTVDRFEKTDPKTNMNPFQNVVQPDKVNSLPAFMKKIK